MWSAVGFPVQCGLSICAASQLESEQRYVGAAAPEGGGLG
jgi:hypothetical protein